MKTPVLEFLFNNAVGLKEAYFEKHLWTTASF